MDRQELQDLQDLLNKCIELWWKPMWIEKCNTVLKTTFWRFALMEKSEFSQDLLVTISCHDLFSEDSWLMEFVDWKNKDDYVFHNWHNYEWHNYAYLKMWSMTAEEKVKYFLEYAKLHD